MFKSDLGVGKMTLDPVAMWAVVRDGRIVHVRTKRGIAEASANIERNVYGFENVKIVPVLLTEVEDVKGDTVS
jgi:hypothetical protein